MNAEIPSYSVEESKEELSPEAQEIITLYGNARDENDPSRQLELLRQVESNLHRLLEPEVAHPLTLSEQDLRNTMVYGVGEFWLGGGSQGQRIKFESERFNPGLENLDGKPKWMRYPQADTFGKETYERFVEIFGSNCIDIAPGVEAEPTGF